jgi:hypothetical protein
MVAVTKAIFMPVEQPEAYRAVVHELLADPVVGEGQMMGMPVLKVGRKLFAGLAGGGALVVKVGRERVETLIGSGRATVFDPSKRGRAMTGWATVEEPADHWLALAEEAKAFCAEE